MLGGQRYRMYNRLGFMNQVIAPCEGTLNPPRPERGRPLDPLQ